MSIVRGSLVTLVTGLMMSAGSLAISAEPAGTPAVQPLYGKINPFSNEIAASWGKINPFYGDVDAFWGKINPFNGDVGAFWGKINPFEGDLTGQWGKIGAFWGNMGASWGEISGSWGKIGAFDIDAYTNVNVQLQDFVARSETFWGPAVFAQTGKSFNEGFAAAVLAKHGIDLNDPASLAKLSPGDRFHFVMDWYDGLMNFSGTDHVDHWMHEVNWTPAVTQQQGSGKRAVIGLLDFFVAGDSDIAGKIISYNGVSNFSNGHGAGVASLMVSAHDGKGVMGIAPNASVIAYNPFDETGTAGWADVKKGVWEISAKGASVINMSLGVPGWTLHPDWQTVFADPLVAAVNRTTIFVMAAGNDGKTQTQNVAWDWVTDPNLIIVGSVDPNGEISSFSNTPGTACLLKKADKDKCTGGSTYLMSRFMVAPGELILVSDDKGGVVRQSGTSFAAPLVSGTIALLHDRWPWLALFPAETIQILFQSAKDLGAPGVDPVYGWGELDVTAAQSVLDFNKLTFYEYSNGLVIRRDAKTVQSQGVKSSWEAAGAYFTVFDSVGKTQRDFNIPLSSRLANQSTFSLMGGQQFQQFLYARLVDWINSGTTKGKGGLLGLGYTTSASDNPYGWNVSFTMVQRPESEYRQDVAADYAVRFSDGGGNMAITAGYGLGSAGLSFAPGFDVQSDYDITSGVNPFLALASGGAFASFDFALSDELRLSTGVTTQDLDLRIDDQALGHERRVFEGLEPYRASALNATLTFIPDEAITLTAAYTRLQEDSGLLGVQWVDASAAEGSVTHVATLGASFDLGGEYRLSGSASFASTATGSGMRNLMLVDTADSSAFEFALSKDSLFLAEDHIRFSVSQPMHVESGRLELTSVEVIDRLTGEIGPVTHGFDIAGERPLFGEVSYSARILDGDGELSIFGRNALRENAAWNQDDETSLGMAFRLNF